MSHMTLYMFTNTPIKEACEVMRKRLNTDKTRTEEENQPECRQHPGTADICIVDNNILQI